MTIGRQVSGLVRLLEAGWSLAKLDSEYIEVSSPAGESFLCRLRSADLLHLCEIYLDHIYGETFSGIVVDIGASNGDSTVYFAKRGAELVVALEPYQESFTLAARNVMKNGLGNKVVLVNMALASSTGSKELVGHRNSLNALRIHEWSDQAGLGERKVRASVQTTSMSHLMEQLDLKTVNFLKMDCEGCEYAVIAGSEVDFGVIKKICLEFHGDPRILVEALISHGFLVERVDSKIHLLSARRPSRTKDD